MWIHRNQDGIRVLTPAKLNLFLEVLGRRCDGFHDIETLMVPVSLYDMLEVRGRKGGTIRLTCDAGALPRSRGGDPAGDIPLSADNLAVHALERLRREAGIATGAEIRLVKRIPVAAGLGGASSDAAAALVAGNWVWGLNWPRERLAALAAELGSDVPFFLGWGAAVCRGRGECLEPVSVPSHMSVVLVRPPEGLSTARVYRRCRPPRRPRSAAPLVAACRRGDWAAVGRGLVNRLQPAARELSPWIDRLQGTFDRLDCWGHQMSGSGTSYFGICRHARHARRVAARLRSQAVGDVRVATTV